MQPLLLFLFVLAGSPVLAQKPAALVGTPDPVTADYSRADSIALAYQAPKEPHYALLADALTKNLKTDHEKFRVLFRWVAENIIYSYANRGAKPNVVLKRRKAVCAGYASLLYSMCASVGIKADMISGYSRTRYYDINRKLKKTDHAWNVVWLYGRQYPVDVTWAAGGFDTQKKKWVKSFDDFYYLTPAEFFVRDHLPKDKKWQLVQKPLNKREFTKPHLYHEGYFRNQLVELMPHKGRIKLRLNDTLTIRFISNHSIDKAVLYSSNRKPLEVTLRRLGTLPSGNRYQVQRMFDRSGTYILSLWLNGERVSTHRLAVVK